MEIMEIMYRVIMYFRCYEMFLVLNLFLHLCVIVPSSTLSMATLTTTIRSEVTATTTSSRRSGQNRTSPTLLTPWKDKPSQRPSSTDILFKLF